MNHRALQVTCVSITVACLLYGLPEQPPSLSPEQKAHIRALITQLGDPDWRRRESAQQELERIGSPAVPYLREALHSADRELLFRAKELLGRLDPTEAVVQIARVVFRPEARSAWILRYDTTFRGAEGRISDKGYGAYRVEVRPGGNRLSFSLAPTGSLTPAACDLSHFQQKRWLAVEEQTELLLWENGVEVEADRRHSVLLLWAAVGPRSHLNGVPVPLDPARSAEEKRRALLAGLLRQLQEQEDHHLRLSTAFLLAKLGQEEAKVALESLPGQLSDCGLALLGDRSAIQRLAERLQRTNTPGPDLQEAALILGELGEPAGLRFLWKHLFEFPEGLFSRAAAVLADQLGGTRHGVVTASELTEFLKLAAGQVLRNWQSALRYLLFRLARHSAVSPTPFRSLLLEALSGPQSTSQSTRTSAFLAALRASIAAFPPQAAEARRIASVCAAHATGAPWKEVALLLPYLVRDGGSDAVQPIVNAVCEKLNDATSTYALRNVLVALALSLPPESTQAQRLAAALAKKLGTQPPKVTTGRTVPLSSGGATLVIEPLAVLLGVPFTGGGTTAVRQRIAQALHAPRQHNGKPHEAVTLSVWHVRSVGREQQAHQAFTRILPPLRPTPVTDRAGNLRILYVQPITETRKTTLVSGRPTSRITRTTTTSPYTYFLTPGRSRRYLKVGQPMLTTSLFPDVQLRAFTASTVYPAERYRTPRTHRLHVVCFPRRGAHRQALTWKEFTDQCVESLKRAQPFQVRSQLTLISTLKLRGAIPLLKKLLHTHPDTEVALHLAQLGDPAGKQYLLSLLSSGSGATTLRAVSHLLDLDPQCLEAVDALLRVAATCPSSQLYSVATSARKALAEPLPGEKQRALLRVLAKRLTVQNASSLIPALRSSTGLDFGYWQTLSMKSSQERQRKIRAVVDAWKRALLVNDTDKRTSPSRSSR